MAGVETLEMVRARLFAGEIHLKQIVEQYLSIIREKNSTLNAFIEVFEEEALLKAQEIQQKIDLKTAGSLAGMVVGIKDNLCYQEHEVTASSAILKGYKAVYNSTVVDRLIQEDAIIIGRLNCDEFAMGASNETSVYGPVLNAANTLCVPGGSSGGSAVAVQAGMCSATLGSDTGGSVRQPAAFCGKWGFKPTYGRVSRYGLIAYASSFDQIGPITSSAEDMAILMDVISGPDAYDATLSLKHTPQFSSTLKQLRNSKRKYKIAVIRDCIEHPGLDPEIKQQTLDFMETLRQQGHTVEGVDFPLLDKLVPCYYVLTTAEASSNLSRYSGLLFGFRSPDASNLEETFKKSRSQGFGDEVKRRIMLGTFVLSSEHYDAYYTKAQKVRNLIQKETNHIFDSYDVILLPTTSTPAFKLGEKTKDPITMYLADLFTVHANLSGNPAISFPFGHHSNGLPFGMQLMAPMYKDEEMLSVALTFQQLSQSLM
jgi:aspartyl-tRNA(Asn)/glutamyl-tRNA(Gln) amidotransferase subunit A